MLNNPQHLASLADRAAQPHTPQVASNKTIDLDFIYSLFSDLLQKHCSVVTIVSMPALCIASMHKPHGEVYGNDQSWQTFQ